MFQRRHLPHVLLVADLWCRHFNDAPLDLLSTHFTGRTEELEYLHRIFNDTSQTEPTRCAIHGMPGLGKTQLVLRFAKISFEQQRFLSVFWISATTVEKINQGFSKILDLVGHPDKSNPLQSARLISTRRWLEEHKSWLLIIDNVDSSTVGFLRDHLPRHSPDGCILFTTRSEQIAKSVASAAGRQQHILSLRPPDLKSSMDLLLSEAGVNSADMSETSTSKAGHIVKLVGCLPLAISQAASFMSESFITLDDLLELYRGEHKIEVSLAIMPLYYEFIGSGRYFNGKTILLFMKKDLWLLHFSLSWTD